MALDGYDERWWPKPKDWPDLGQYQTEEALALLILEEIVISLAHCQETKGCSKAPTLHVGCNDLFYWACADCEPLPVLGFYDDVKEAAFWDLYNRVRRDGAHGSQVWCCVRRGMRPQAPIERDWRACGKWTEELEALPKR